MRISPLQVTARGLAEKPTIDEIKLVTPEPEAVEIPKQPEFHRLPVRRIRARRVSRSGGTGGEAHLPEETELASGAATATEEG